MKLISALTFLMLSLTSFAGGVHGWCSPWEQMRDRTCIFNNKATKFWVRQCEHLWDLENICTDDNPNRLSRICTKWVKMRGVSCARGGPFEQKWVRSCTTRFQREILCTNYNPNR